MTDREKRRETSAGPTDGDRAGAWERRARAVLARSAATLARLRALQEELKQETEGDARSAPTLPRLPPKGGHTVPPLEAEGHTAIRPPAQRQRAIADRRTIRAGLRAALKVIAPYRDAIINGYCDPGDEAGCDDPDLRADLAPVGRGIARIQAALDATAMMPRAPGVSKEVKALLARVTELQAIHNAASDQLDAAFAKVDALCPRPAILAEREHSPAVLAQMIGGDDFYTAAQRIEIAAHLARLNEADKALGLTEMEEAYEAAGRAWSDAEDAVLAFPARSIAGVLAKLKFGARVAIFESAPAETITRVIADLERLTGQRS